MENTIPPNNTNEKNLERQIIEMNKETIRHLEKNAEHWFKSWWMLSIVYPLVVTVGGAVLVTVVQRSRAKTPERQAPVTRDAVPAVHKPIREVIRDRIQK